MKSMTTLAARMLGIVTAVAMVVGGIATVSAGQNLTIKGSDTMVILGQRWAERYMNANPGVAIQVTGGGSGTGIAALLNKTTDIANSSRPIKDKERQDALKNGVEAYEYRVAMDALAVVVNAQNSINELTMKQVMGIYIGAINNWKQVGGPDASILRYSRESNSGTYVFFKEHVLQNKDYAADCQTMPGTSAVSEAVSRDAGGIGYGGVAYFASQPSLKILAIKKDENSPAIYPLLSNGQIDFPSVWEERYPIARFLFMYTAGKPQGVTREYLDWILGPEGQRIVDEIGYVPLAG